MKTTLTEFESKQFLEPYGISVINEKKATTIDETVEAAKEIGFPVVVKGLGKELLHKT